jgi:hypothetical protein
MKSYLSKPHVLNASQLLKQVIFGSLLALTLLTSVALFLPSSSLAASPATCERNFQCVNNQRCIFHPFRKEWILYGSCGSAIIGEVTPPQGVAEYNEGGQIGIFRFGSVLMKLAAIVAGIWVMANIIIAGYEYITSSGDAGVHTKVRDRLTWSVVGLIVIVVAYAGAGILGLIFFGDASFILNPIFQSAITAQ